MRPPCDGRSGRAGFTLVEVMVALLIVGFLMLSITEILGVARNSRDVIHNIQERQLAGPAILAQIESDLRGLLVYDRDQRGALRVGDRVLSGFDADTLDFVSTADSLLPFAPTARSDFQRADVTEVGYHLRQNPDSDDFLELYRREGFGVDDAPFEGGRFALLHDRVKRFNIEVYAEDGPDGEPLDQWGTDRDENVGLPKWILIELTLELAPRLVREQLIIDRREVTYRRIYRFPRELELALRLQPVPLIPQIGPPVAPNAVGGAAGGGGLVDPGSPDEGGQQPDPGTGDGQLPFEIQTGTSGDGGVLGG